jgi:hypothetical protein
MPKTEQTATAILERVALDAMRVKTQTGAGLSLAEQRALLAHVDRQQEQGADNLDRLVAARQKFDALAMMEGDGSVVSEELLAGLMELGSILGRNL